MSVQVTIPTAQHYYFDEIRYCFHNVTQVTKLLRFSATACDLGCNNYKMWDYQGKEMTNREKYLDWRKRWKENYLKLSNTIRFYKQMRVRKFFDMHIQQLRKVNRSTAEMSDNELYEWYLITNQINLDHLQRCAQHMLNGRFLMKLAGAEMRRREIEARDVAKEEEMLEGFISSEDIAESPHKISEADLLVKLEAAE